MSPEDGELFNPYSSKKAFQKAASTYTKPEVIPYLEMEQSNPDDLETAHPNSVSFKLNNIFAASIWRKFVPFQTDEGRQWLR